MTIEITDDPPSQPFHVGDVVMIKSGGPAMTIAEVHDVQPRRLAICVFATAAGEVTYTRGLPLCALIDADDYASPEEVEGLRDLLACASNDAVRWKALADSRGEMLRGGQDTLDNLRELNRSLQGEVTTLKRDLATERSKFAGYRATFQQDIEERRRLSARVAELENSPEAAKVNRALRDDNARLRRRVEVLEAAVSEGIAWGQGDDDLDYLGDGGCPDLSAPIEMAPEDPT